MQPTRFLEVSRPRQVLIRLCQRVNYGSILNLTVIGGELSFDPAPEVLVEVRLDADERPRHELFLPDFALCTEVLADQDAADGLTDEDAVPDLPQTPTNITGDLWILGNHRLLVGDATKAFAASRLHRVSHDCRPHFTHPPGMHGTRAYLRGCSMMSRTLARRLDRIEAKLNPPDKPRITVIVDGAGEAKIFHLPALAEEPIGPSQLATDNST
jgi:hypothetical protein